MSMMRINGDPEQEGLSCKVPEKIKISLSGAIELHEAIEEKRRRFIPNDAAGFSCILTDEYYFWRNACNADYVLRKFLSQGKYDRVSFEQVKYKGRPWCSEIKMSHLLEQVLYLDAMGLEKIRQEMCGCRYSPMIEAYLQLRGARFGSGSLDKGLYRAPDALQAYMKSVNDFLVDLRMTLSSAEMVKKDRNWLASARKNVRSVRNYLISISKHFNVKVVQLELGYRAWNDAISMNLQGKLYPRSLNKAVVRRDKEAWMRSIRGRYGDYWLGCIWRIEFSPCDGYRLHVHVILRANASVDDVLVGVSMGQLWVDGVNDGQGEFLCVNQFKSKVLENGIGYIPKGHDEKINKLWRSIGRRLMLDGILRPNLISEGRNFGHSQVKAEVVASMGSKLEKHLDNMVSGKLVDAMGAINPVSKRRSYLSKKGASTPRFTTKIIRESGFESKIEDSNSIAQDVIVNTQYC